MRIPEPQDLDSLCCQEYFAFSVVTLLVGTAMAGTIKFDGEAGFFAKEIEIVIASRMLATKFVTAKMPVAQPTPHEFFRPRFFFPKQTGSLGAGHELDYGECGGKMESVFISPSPVLTRFRRR